MHGEKGVKIRGSAEIMGESAEIMGGSAERIMLKSAERMGLEC